MSEFKTPGVFIEEIPKFPPSVAQVETAVPSFIGYTEIAEDKNKPLKMVPTKISSLMDYETYFGKANKESIKLQDTVGEGLTLVKPNVKFLMYYSLQMYFANGGGPCYIVSVGPYGTDVVKDDLKSGLEASALQEESTIVVFPDAVSLTDQEEFYALYQDAIAQANDLKNRFVIMDTFLGESKSEDEETGFNTVEFLRNRIARTMHAAAYFPHLKTVLNYRFDEDVAIDHAGLQPADATGGFFAASVADLEALILLATAELAGVTEEEPVDREALIDIVESVIAIVEEVKVTADSEISLTAIQGYLQAFKNEDANLVIGTITSIITTLKDAVSLAQDKKGDAHGLKLGELKTTNSVLYNQIKKVIGELKVVLPPSATMAGVYAKVDGTQGVWKSPANLGLNYVIAPTQKISNKEQESLNVDTNGKSINAIRTFTGKGNLVWGARTFDSEDTEWKYISVRRLFDMVEKSVQNAMQRFVFETNDANTWVKAKTMIENYLNQLWMSGALAGPTPEKAYYVIVGKETTTDQDVLEGRMNIEIGMAAVRPAEFIVLNFSHKLQEA
ncbi:phage tail sheath family protein [Flavobacterium supellecticarium]|uniref:Phage tail sheath family protein n=1 Tax=Flavobacterium supellecticarium TaxID=2565924 RepID=A0A4S3ZP98_9FLAO|nr:phage tail sheath C-terminal domain-containing protein [Flavobacterium supellecticarium]THF47318.1 phage tail sheath family protein [Flavobacterium supellecticarium]